MSSSKKKWCKAKKSSENKRFIKINRYDISCEILAFYTLIAFVIILYYFNFYISFLYNVCSVSICLLMRWKMTQTGETGETQNYRLNSSALKKIWALNWKNTFLSSIYFLNPTNKWKIVFSTSDISFITF